MASRDTTRSSGSFNEKVAGVLRDPANYPPEFDAHVRSLIVRNPLVKIEPYQLPTLDKKHVVNAASEPAFQNLWAAAGGGYEAPSFYKDPNFRVYLQGEMVGGTIPAGAFILPPLYRPLGQLVFAVISNNALGEVDVFPDGTVYVVSGSNLSVSLSGISFRIL